MSSGSLFSHTLYNFTTATDIEIEIIDMNSIKLKVIVKDPKLMTYFTQPLLEILPHLNNDNFKKIKFFISSLERLGETDVQRNSV